MADLGKIGVQSFPKKMDFNFSISHCHTLVLKGFKILSGCRILKYTTLLNIEILAQTITASVTV